MKFSGGRGRGGEREWELKDFLVKRNVFEKVYWSFLVGGVKKILQGRGRLHFGLKQFTLNVKFTSTLVYLMLFIHTQITN